MKPVITISVVLPIHNEEKYIATALKSLIHQDFKEPFEILVVNNNSTDKTIEIVNAYQDKRIKIVEEKQQGVVFARQKGLHEAKGVLIAGADADSVYPSNWLTTITHHFKNHHVIGVGGPAIPERNPWWMYYWHLKSFGFVAWLYQKTGFVLYVIASNFAFRKSVFLSIGGYDTRFSMGGGDEIDPLARLRKKGKVVFDQHLQVNVSSRRYQVGFLKFLFIHSMYYYWFGYLASLLFKRRLIESSPVR
ncbi:glycosyltransferase [Candidatus Microgenomates bacterium]|nr:MAG: glycosyltransferase [Candidatus Microgenomates bacterium]